MNPDKFSSLEILRLEFTLSALEQTDLPYFLGSTLRGSFGHALKESACPTDPRACAESCSLPSICAYFHIFETAVPALYSPRGTHEDLPHPFVFVVPDYDGKEHRRRLFNRGDKLSFGITLIGQATLYLRYIIGAAERMAHRGIGVNRSKFEPVSLVFLDADGEDLSPCSLGDLVQERMSAAANIDKVAIGFQTPVRIRLGGELQTSISFDLLIKNLARRVSMLSAAHCREALKLEDDNLLERAKQVRTIKEELHWEDIKRHSNRQKFHNNQGGLIGKISYAGIAISEFLPLLIAGEYLNVGAATSFGLGRYRIEV